MDAETNTNRNDDPKAVAADRQQDFQKVIAFFSDKHSFDLHNRQVNGVERILRKCTPGFYVADLLYATRLIELIQKKINDTDEHRDIFIELLLKVLRISGAQFQIEKMSDMVKFKLNIITFINCVSELLRHNSSSVQTAVLEVFYQYTSRSSEHEQFLKCLKDCNIEYILHTISLYMNSDNNIQQQLSVSIILEFSYQKLFVIPLLKVSIIDKLCHSYEQLDSHMKVILNDLQINIKSDVLYSCIEKATPLLNLNYQDWCNKTNTELFNENQLLQWRATVKEIMKSNNWEITVFYIVLFEVEQIRRLEKKPDQSKISFLSFQEINKGILDKAIQLSELSKWKLHTDHILKLNEIVWNFTEYQGEIHLSQDDCTRLLFALRSNLSTILIAKSKPVPQKQRTDLFNEILVIVSLLAKYPFSNDAFLSSNIIDTLLEYTTHNPVNGDVHLDLEFETKQILLTVLFHLSKFPECMKLIVKSDFIKSAVQYLNINFIEQIETTKQTLWTPNQLYNLQLQIISTLTSMIPFCIVEFIKLDGINSLIRWLSLNSQSTIHKQNLLEMKHSVLRLLVFICNTAAATQIAQIDIDSNKFLMKTILELMKEVLTDESYCDLTSILSFLLYQNIDYQNEFYNEGGAKLLLSHLSIYEEKYMYAKSDLFMISIIDCLWNSLSQPNNIGDFIKLEGIETLLDMIESCPTISIQNQILSCLIDLISHYELAKDQLIMWQSNKNNTKIKTLLINLWNREEERLAIQTDDGILADPKRPLTKKIKEKKKRNLNQPVIIDMRTNIYLIFTKIGFEDNSLNAREQGKMKLIQNYMEFKIGEEWYNIAMELEQESLQPVPNDEKKIDKMLHDNYTRALITRQQQQQLLDIDIKKQIQEEFEVYKNYQLSKGKIVTNK